MLKLIRSILGRQKDTASNCSQTKESEWQSFHNLPNDSTVSKLVLEYSKNKKMTETQLMDIRTRFNTWEKDGREVDF